MLVVQASKIFPLIAVIALAQAAIISLPNLIVQPRPPTNNTAPPRYPPDPTVWHVYDTDIDLIFSDYGRFVNEIYFRRCLRRASNRAEEEIERGGDVPIPINVPINCVYQTAAFSIVHYGQITWGMLKEVYKGMGEFQLNYGTFEAQFIIYDEVTMDNLGAGNIRRVSRSPLLDTANRTALVLPINGIHSNLSSA